MFGFVACGDEADSDDGVPDTKVRVITHWNGDFDEHRYRVVIVNDTFLCVESGTYRGGGNWCMIAPGEELTDGFVNQLRQGALDLR